ncbi:sugar phosphate nucleotidyltransferase [Methanocella sp. MCL-LM]|uniref:nucleotidyltransferase family protein n=1 Tax=Methanocella sp. MCL-LM TaxID=3412035 RepID=UPI003C7936D1
MKACILCGGTGTRLRPLTFERPKPSIPILNKPSVGHLVEHLSKNGFNEIVITLGYMGEVIEKYLGDGSLFGVDIKYVYEKEKLGTAGSVKNAEKYLAGGPFLVVGGDHVLNLNLRELYDFHNRTSGMVTISVLSIDDPREFGIVDLDNNHVIHRFKEKPGPGEIFSNLASTGIYALSPEVFDYIPKQKYDFAKDLFPKLLKDGKKISGWLARGQWTDVGNPQAYRAAQKWMLENMPGTYIHGRLLVEGAKLNGPLDVGNNVSVGKNSVIVGPVVIGENTVIGDNVLIGPYTSIGKACNIGSDCRILASYVYDGAKIGAGCSVSGAIIDDDVSIGKACTLENGTVIGPRTMIGNDVTVHSDVRIWPEVVVQAGVSVVEDTMNEQFATDINGS